MYCTVLCLLGRSGHCCLYSGCSDPLRQIPIKTLFYNNLILYLQIVKIRLFYRFINHNNLRQKSTPQLIFNTDRLRLYF